MIAPAQGFASPKEGKNSGSWVELRDESGAVLFHRRVHDPFRRCHGPIQWRENTHASALQWRYSREHKATPMAVTA